MLTSKLLLPLLFFLLPFNLGLRKLRVEEAREDRVLAQNVTRSFSVAKWMNAHAHQLFLC
jgi:hypothetical protein